nr:universal stress protein [Halorubrum sp. CBA1125]
MTDHDSSTDREEPTHTTDAAHEGAAPERPTVLVPMAVLDGESLPEGVAALLANARVVLLGYHVIPEQTAAEQAREQFGERAMAKLGEIAAALEAAGADVDTRLVFTHERQATIDRMIYEEGCLAVLVANGTEGPESVLVAVRGAVGLDRIARLVAGLFATTDTTITLYHSLGEGGAGGGRRVAAGGRDERARRPWRGPRRRRDADRGVDGADRRDRGPRAGPRRGGDGRDGPVGDDVRLRDARRASRGAVPRAGPRRPATPADRWRRR